MTMSKRRKPGRPARELGALPILMRFSRNAEIDLQLIPHAALENIREGRGSEQDWHTLAFRVNVGQMLGRQAFAGRADVHGVMDAGVVAVAELGKRYRRAGRMVATGDELRAIGEALCLTDELQENTTRRQQLVATRSVYITATATAQHPTGELIAA